MAINSIMAIKKSSIQASKRLIKFLKKNCVRKGETYEEIIWRLLALKQLTEEQFQQIKSKYEEHLR